MPRQVTVVIVNWQRPLDTIACVHSVQRTQLKQMHILVVDNGSQDDSVTLIRSACPETEILTLPQNLGFSGGYNAGIQQAIQNGAETLFLLNNDTLIEPDTIPNLLAAPWDVTVPKIVYADAPTRIWAAGATWRKFPPSVKMIGYNQPDSPVYQTERELNYATGCALLISRQVAEVTGGFDPLYESYMEDYDFFYRVQQNRFRIGYVPEALVYHKVSRTLGGNTPRVWQYMGRNTVLFYRKESRFSRLSLTTYLLWVSGREAVRGNWRALPPFWKGIRQGIITLLKQ